MTTVETALQHFKNTEPRKKVAISAQSDESIHYLHQPVLLAFNITQAESFSYAQTAYWQIDLSLLCIAFLLDFQELAQLRLSKHFQGSCQI